jgi:hypothetical protein
MSPACKEIATYLSERNKFGLRAQHCASQDWVQPRHAELSLSLLFPALAWWGGGRERKP